MFGPERPRLNQLEDAGDAGDCAHGEPTQRESPRPHTGRRHKGQDRGERASRLQDPGDPQHSEGPPAGERDHTKAERCDGNWRQQEKEVDQGQGAGDDGKGLVRYADTLPKQGAALSQSHESEEDEQDGGGGKDPADLRADRIRESHLERVRDPGQEEDCPERQIDDREDAQSLHCVNAMSRRSP